MAMNGQWLLQKQVRKRAALQMTGWRVLKTTRAQRSFLLMKFVNHDSTPPIGNGGGGFVVLL